MTILLTGGLGFLGRAVLRQALNENHHVIVLCRRVPEAMNDKNVHFIVGDIANGAGMSTIPWAELDRIIHLAAAGVKAVRRGWADAIDVNVVGTHRLLDFVAGHACRNPAIFIARTFYETALERFPTLRENPYVVTKAAATELVRIWSNSYSGSVVLGSIFQLYGPGDDADSVLTYVARSLKATQACRLGSGQGVRDWLYVDDAARAVMAAVEDPAAGVTECDIGSGELRSIGDMVQLLATIADVDSRLLQFDATRDRNDVELKITARTFPNMWRPKVPVDEGLRLLYKNS